MQWTLRKIRKKAGDWTGVLIIPIGVVTMLIAYHKISAGVAFWLGILLGFLIGEEKFYDRKHKEIYPG